MLVMITENQLLTPQTVCQTCLWADQNGQPRWRQGHLGCGRVVANSGHDQPPQFECQMGFRVTSID
ncbi:MAG TPA: hypothetical protein IGR64_02330 [Leptolyngbyaceae cyanobacterium M65_K2018_010]|nr:hypothetical protein [Leptolyngbyaceae cyanobacterium M65_K2018_010]